MIRRLMRQSHVGKVSMIAECLERRNITDEKDAGTRKALEYS